jgi:hypothetical protein
VTWDLVQESIERRKAREVFDEQRDKAKKVAKKGVIAMTQVAAILAGAAVVGTVLAATGVGAAPGLAIAVVCGGGAALATWLANDYDDLADDPPRPDYKKLTTYTAPATRALSPSSDPRAISEYMERRVQDFVDSLYHMGNAVSALTVSLERYDGALGDKGGGSDSDQIAQLGAIQHNAGEAGRILLGLATSAPLTNLNWGNFRTQLQTRRSVSAPAPSRDAGRQVLAKSWRAAQAELTKRLKISGAT